MPDFDLAIFDFDGTLADSRQGIFDAMRQTLRELGLPPLTEDATWVIGPSIYDIYAKALATDDPRVIHRGIAAFRRHYARTGPGQTPPFPGALDMIAGLRARGKRLAICSLKAADFIQDILQRWGIPNAFESIVATSLDPATTQHTKEMLIERVLAAAFPSGASAPEDALRARAQRAVMIGDTASDILAARYWGMRSVAALYGYGDKAQIAAAGPGWSCHSVAELACLLNSDGAAAAC